MSVAFFPPFTESASDQPWMPGAMKQQREYDGFTLDPEIKKVRKASKENASKVELHGLE